ncbi:MAG: hypothetical protein KC503_40475 [Myxococcales bacterium]|nr:hypothetical protein [Myxococcales bacterium]
MKSGSAFRAERALATLCICLCSCGASFDLSDEALRDPEACKSCHPQHFEQWSGSMHAYASTDPVFLAMNARGQRETNGALGDFCVRCHAPMALRGGASSDGLDLPSLPASQQGVTCYFCHQVSAVAGSHNNPLALARDRHMRGGIEDPIATNAHGTAYSTLHAGAGLDSSRLCGSCHDVVTPAGVFLERTFAEWKRSNFSREQVVSQLTCSECHMPTRAAEPDRGNISDRDLHDHGMPGLDVALTDFPRRDAQRAAIERSLATVLVSQLCVSPTQSGSTKIVVTLENIGAGHSFPSGAAHDRRVWVEVKAYAGDKLVFETGAVGDSEAVAAKRASDTDLWTFGDRVFDDAGKPVHMFWDVRRVQSALLQAPSAGINSQLLHYGRTFEIPETPTRVTVRVRVRPIGLDIIDDLIDSGDLDKALRALIPTFTLRSTEIEWRDTSTRLCAPSA